MSRYVISYTSQTAGEKGSGGGTFFHAPDDEAALAIQEAIAAVQMPQVWKSLTASVAIREGQTGGTTKGTHELRLNAKYADDTLGYYHFPLVRDTTSSEQIARLLTGEEADEVAVPISPQGQPIQAIVKTSSVNMR